MRGSLPTPATTASLLQALLLLTLLLAPTASTHVGPIQAESPQDEDDDGRSKYRTVERYVFAASIDGKASTPGTTRRLTPSGHFYQAHVHPTLDLVAVAGLREQDTTFNLWVCTLQGKELRCITDDLCLSVQPTWVPGTTRIVFVSSRGSDRSKEWKPVASKVHLWMTDVDASFYEQLTFGDHSDVRPMVSPDGREVVFLSDRSGEYHVWVLSLETKELRQLVTGGGADSRPAWSPSGEWIVHGARKETDGRDPKLDPLLVLLNRRTGEEVGPVGLDRFASMKGAFFLDESRILFHGRVKGASRTTSTHAPPFGLWVWDRTTNQFERFELDGFEAAAHATVSADRRTLVFDSRENPAGVTRTGQD